MLKQRITTALVLLPLVLVVIFQAPLELFCGFIAIAAYLLGLEWARLAGFEGGLSHTAYAVLISLANFAIWSISGDFLMWPSPSWPMKLVWDLPLAVLGASLIAIGVAVFIVLTYSRLPKWWANRLVISLLGLLILPAFFVSVISIRSIGYLTDTYHGGWLVLMMFCLVWAADTGAYVTGKAFGRTKLASIVSPNKTWEGAAGGMILCICVAWLGAYLLDMPIENGWVYCTLAFFLAIFSVLGDLFESAMKRVNNIKDSGDLLPGHGGVLDRLDSSLVVAPLFYLAFSFFGWF